MDSKTADFIVNKILDQGKFLYHGTIEVFAHEILSDGVDLRKGKPSVDFGRGFYTTPSITFAQKCASWKETCFEHPAILRIEIDTEKLEAIESFRIFEAADTEWAQFVINNRAGYRYRSKVKSVDHNQGRPPQHDIVYGEVADWQIVNITADLKENPQQISHDLAQRLYNKSYGKQFTFHTKKALSCIRNIELRKLRNYR